LEDTASAAKGTIPIGENKILLQNKTVHHYFRSTKRLENLKSRLATPMKISGYRIVNDYGTYEGMKFHDDVEYETVAAAVKAALDSRYGVPFLIMRVIDWQAMEKLGCPYPDCPRVHYKECPTHGTRYAANSREPQNEVGAQTIPPKDGSM
jgi:hypothetical protein